LIIPIVTNLLKADETVNKVREEYVFKSISLFMKIHEPDNKFSFLRETDKVKIVWRWIKKLVLTNKLISKNNNFKQNFLIVRLL